jgi:hypothetical protein
VTRPDERHSRSSSSPDAAPGALSDVGALLGRPEAALPPVDPAALRAMIEVLLLLAEHPADEPIVRQLHDIVSVCGRPAPPS